MSSIEYMQFLTSVGAAAAVSWVVFELTAEPIAYTTNNTQLALVNRSNSWFDAIINNLPVVLLFIAGMGAISLTVFRSKFT